MRNPVQLTSGIVSILFPAFVSAALFGGCTMMQGEGRQQTESMLVTSGFKMNVADTPAELAALETRPQRKLTPLKRKGKLYFSYVDAKGCNCSYLGDEDAYQKYQGLMVDNRLVEESRGEPAVSMPYDVILVEDDDEWGAWGGVLVDE